MEQIISNEKAAQMEKVPPAFRLAFMKAPKLQQTAILQKIDTGHRIIRHSSFQNFEVGKGKQRHLIGPTGTSTPMS